MAIDWPTWRAGYPQRPAWIPVVSEVGKLLPKLRKLSSISRKETEKPESLLQKSLTHLAPQACLKILSTPLSSERVSLPTGAELRALHHQGVSLPCTLAESLGLQCQNPAPDLPFTATEIPPKQRR